MCAACPDVGQSPQSQPSRALLTPHNALPSCCHLPAASVRTGRPAWQFADLERRVGTSFSQIGDKLDVLAVLAAAQGKGAAPAVPAAPGVSTTMAMSAMAAIGDGDFSPIPIKKGGAGQAKKTEFASFGAPESVTKQLTHTTAHICSGRDFTNGKIPNSDQHASCYFRYLCVAPGEGPAPDHFRSRGHFDWYVRWLLAGTGDRRWARAVPPGPTRGAFERGQRIAFDLRACY